MPQLESSHITEGAPLPSSKPGPIGWLVGSQPVLHHCAFCGSIRDSTLKLCVCISTELNCSRLRMTEDKCVSRRKPPRCQSTLQSLSISSMLHRTPYCAKSHNDTTSPDLSWLCFFRYRTLRSLRHLHTRRDDHLSDMGAGRGAEFTMERSPNPPYSLELMYPYEHFVLGKHLEIAAVQQNTCPTRMDPRWWCCQLLVCGHGCSPSLRKMWLPRLNMHK